MSLLPRSCEAVHARLKGRLCAVALGVDTVLRLVLTLSPLCSSVACSFKVTCSLCEGSWYPLSPKPQARGLLRWTLFPMKLEGGGGIVPGLLWQGGPSPVGWALWSASPDSAPGPHTYCFSSVFLNSVGALRTSVLRLWSLSSNSWSG